MHLNKYYKKAVADTIKAKYGEVSFKTFVQYILDDKGCRMKTKCSLDTHWLPFYINCGYCSLRYKYFVRADLLSKINKIYPEFFCKVHVVGEDFVLISEVYYRAMFHIAMKI